MPEPLSATAAKIVYRDGRAADVPLLFSSWLGSMKDSMVESKGRIPDISIRVTSPVFHAGQHARIDALIADADTRIRCAALFEDLDTVLGWSIARGDCLHYVFVKDAWRRQGIGRALIPAEVKRFSTRTRSGDSFIVPLLAGAIYDPFAIDPRTP